LHDLRSDALGIHGFGQVGRLPKPLPSGPSSPQWWIMSAKVTFTKPNLYQLQGGGIHVTYSTTGFDGKPHFTYQDPQGSHNFSGDQINVAQTTIGEIVTVTIRLTVDSGSTSFSVIIPTVNLTTSGQAAHIDTEGITTVHRFSIVPSFNQGQTELYRFTPLSGTAEQVAF